MKHCIPFDVFQVMINCSFCSSLLVVTLLETNGLPWHMESLLALLFLIPLFVTGFEGSKRIGDVTDFFQFRTVHIPVPNSIITS